MHLGLHLSTAKCHSRLSATQFSATMADNKARIFFPVDPDPETTHQWSFEVLENGESALETPFQGTLRPEYSLDGQNWSPSVNTCIGDSSHLTATIFGTNYGHALDLTTKIQIENTENKLTWRPEATHELPPGSYSV